MVHTLMTEKSSKQFDGEYGLGATYKAKFFDIGDQQLKMQVWDTPGSEQYRSLLPMYLKNSQAVIVCFALDDEESFESLEHWGRYLEEQCTEMPFIAVFGLRSELREDPGGEVCKSQEECQQEYQSLFGAKGIGIGYYELSTHEDPLGVHKAFEQIGEILLKKGVCRQ